MSGTTYLLDTNIVSHMMVNAEGLAAQRAQALLHADCTLCTSIIVQCEIEYGLAKRPAQRLQKAWGFQLAQLPVLPLDGAVALHYAHMRASLEAAGKPIGANDALIAAHALSLDAILVSADTAFAQVPGLRVENWLLE